ncbi:lantibiotic dehydratase family protein [Actinorugispora endophytica]|uniref:Lantibiotic biosynthesis dehydratase-like protein n=1 Tax=Actinorugispora endophytica TaxID=1605990 RepID=A0A4R6UHJ9_9ACTN|nr:lantibiotic dehydratase family protein [Actinorugispora endophytica]TDQ46318.1 lantibiotic biosynthesis dehydratase-like protein [Actinorugispora endophytica]
MTRSRRTLYRGTGQGMLRAAVARTVPDMAPWPQADAPIEQWRAWLDSVWAQESFREAVEAASPDLAGRVQALVTGHTPKPRRVRRAALALARYALRSAHRSTPYGLFAGVAPVAFGDTVHMEIGAEHRVVSRPDPVGLDAAIRTWQATPEHLAEVEVCVNTLARQRGDRVHVPAEGDAEYTLAWTPVLALVLEVTRAPIRFATLAGKVAAQFPDVPAPRRLAALAELVWVGLLLSSLRAPATLTDATVPLPEAVQRQAEALPAASDLLLDATVRLPAAVAVEAETAATVLTRLSPAPTGTAAWARYADRFTDRYGDAVVPLNQVTADLGLPEGFEKPSSPPRPMKLRDRLLLDLAGTAALQGRRSVTLTEEMIERLEAAAGEREQTPPHLEVCAQVHAPTPHALQAGRFRLHVVTVSRAAGSMTGRFWHLLPHMPRSYAGLPTVAPGTEAVQLSFHPARVAADLLTRAPQVLPRLISVGEFRHPAPGVLFPADLAIGQDGGRLFLCETATRQRLEALAPTALNFVWNHYTPPLVRFLAEIARARTPQVTGFEWGAAWTLPFTPAVHYRRSVLVPARWKLQARDLPGRTAPSQVWEDRFDTWRAQSGVPDRVLLVQDDQQLPLDLTKPMHVSCRV